jgi:5-formyltetrahydrofolate cyclo-ligase
MHSSDAIAVDKKKLREATLAQRDALPPEVRADAAEKIAARGLPFALKPGQIVSGFMPIKTEINPLPLMKKLSEAGAKLALPRIAGRGKPLSMRAWAVGDPFEKGQWGIREPQSSAPEVVPDIVLAPLAAFDRRGNRLGYGAGYYDMTIKAARAQKPVLVVGLAYSIQEFDEVPVTERDEPLDFVLTERETIDLRGA